MDLRLDDGTMFPYEEECGYKQNGGYVFMIPVEALSSG
jgi:hypothetical protein